MKYIIGNWKANKNLREAQSWIDAFFSNNLSVIGNDLTVIICPPFPLIPIVSEACSEHQNIVVGAQDISIHEPGKFTGEVTYHSLSGLVEFIIVGHSERRNAFQESNDIVHKKIQNAIKSDIEPILCVRGLDDIIPGDINFVAYEPVHAIGTGNNESVDSVLEMKKKLNLDSEIKYIYGGSVNPSNVREYTEKNEIDGVLPGGASLDPDTFYSLINNAL